MKIELNIPPRFSRLTRFEFNAFWNWAAGLVKALKTLVYNLDDDNIKSISAGKIKGSLNLADTPISGGVIIITDDSFRLANADGSQYIELSGGVISIKANIINNNE